MSEANVPPRHESPDNRPSGPAFEPRRPQSPAEFPKVVGSPEHIWPPAPLAGTAGPDADAFPDSPPSPAPVPREAELLYLIRDLNRCNEALMARVNQLEEALETSQQSLQAEVERSHHLANRPEEKVAAAQQRSTAQLLSELETASDGLKRQRILTETLQAQLDTSQDRVTQLERECTLLQQRQTERLQALEKSEDLCRDLRSRLQRQQRYTLQFKAALEKCLDMNAQTPLAIPTNAVMDIPYSNLEGAGSNPISMPRADRIQPWSSQEGDSTGPALDPQLMALLRQPASHFSEAQAPVRPAPAPAPAATTGEADTRLWQDLERVIDHSVSPRTAPTPAPPPSVPEQAAPEQATFTEPSPWGPPQPRPTPTWNADLDSVEDAETAFEVAPNAVAPPWQAMEMPSPRPANPAPQTDAIDVQARLHFSPGELPLMGQTHAQGGAPSPLVHPLRPAKKKRTSLSAVELPSFPPLPRNSGTP
ncbi:hypothetical protein [Leptolyngbya sp. PCC 6406]|uniref:hypothetical protein n=1 Tax=Leptolyngbya sp. PCC 6406 TaxID=1173264 RepID=UPI0002ABA201|nr:hypothetical protein [Leptolyngbya sp. PCC 6406]